MAPDTKITTVPVPSDTIQQQHGMSAFGDVQGYLVDMQ